MLDREIYCYRTQGSGLVMLEQTELKHPQCLTSSILIAQIGTLSLEAGILSFSSLAMSSWEADHDIMGASGVSSAG